MAGVCGRGKPRWHREGAGAVAREHQSVAVAGAWPVEGSAGGQGNHCEGMMVEWLLRIMSADEEQDVAAYMSRLATASIRHASRLPTADVLWVKAQMLERWEAERRVQAPLDVMEPFQIGAGLVAAGILLFWSLPALIRVIS